jgi:sarcosine oxidase
MDKPKRIAVRGAGSMGSQAMWRLAAHGAEVVCYDRYAQHVLPEGHTAVLDRAGGTIGPEASVKAAAARAEQLGARLHRYTPVREVVPAPGGGVDVVIDTATDQVDSAVVTAGPWINTLFPDLGGR